MIWFVGPLLSSWRASYAVCLCSSMQQLALAACVALSTRVVLKSAQALSPSLALLLTLPLYISLCRPLPFTTEEFYTDVCMAVYFSYAFANGIAVYFSICTIQFVRFER